MYRGIMLGFLLISLLHFISVSPQNDAFNKYMDAGCFQCNRGKIDTLKLMKEECYEYCGYSASSSTSSTSTTSKPDDTPTKNSDTSPPTTAPTNSSSNANTPSPQTNSTPKS